VSVRSGTGDLDGDDVQQQIVIVMNAVSGRHSIAANLHLNHPSSIQTALNTAAKRLHRAMRQSDVLEEYCTIPPKVYAEFLQPIRLQHRVQGGQTNEISLLSLCSVAGHLGERPVGGVNGLASSPRRQ